MMQLVGYAKEDSINNEYLKLVLSVKVMEEIKRYKKPGIKEEYIDLLIKKENIERVLDGKQSCVAITTRSEQMEE